MANWHGRADFTKVTKYLTTANNALATGQTTTAAGAGIFLRTFASEAGNHLAPVDASAYRQVMTDLTTYGSDLTAMEFNPSAPIQPMVTALKKATADLEAHKTDSWAKPLLKAMLVKVPGLSG
jgi:hypothetical protein